MAERRQGPFPAHGELVTAEDGTAWLWTGAAWEHAGEVMSLAESERMTAREREVARRLDVATQVWERAFASAPFVRTHGKDMRATDPLPTFAEYVARAVMTDAIAETCDGRPLGLAEHTTQQIHGLLGPGLALRVANMLQRHVIAVRAALRLSGR